MRSCQIYSFLYPSFYSVHATAFERAIHGFHAEKLCFMCSMCFRSGVLKCFFEPKAPKYSPTPWWENILGEITIYPHPPKKKEIQDFLFIYFVIFYTVLYSYSNIIFCFPIDFLIIFRPRGLWIENTGTSISDKMPQLKVWDLQLQELYCLKCIIYT